MNETEKELQPSQADSETLGIRIKRESNPCVKARYYKDGKQEVVCKTWGWGCLSSIQTGNQPQCVPVYDSGMNITDCRCA